MDFSLRRTHGFDSGMKVARSSYLAGFAGTSNVLAGEKYGIPLSGTMAHSFVTSFGREADAIYRICSYFPGPFHFSDRYLRYVEGRPDGRRGVSDNEAGGRKLLGVRLDSGDLVDLSRKVRRILDEGGQQDVKIFASGDLDEYRIEDILARDAKIDAFGVGTRMGVSADAPSLEIVYKMVRLGDRNVRKMSSGKETLGGRKQVFRKVSPDGGYLKDIIAAKEERIPDAHPLLEAAMKSGQRTAPHATSLEEIRATTRKNLGLLGENYKRITSPKAFPVELSSRLEAIQE